MATLAQLRKQAKDLGVPRDFILKASSTTLQAMVDDAQTHDGKPKRAVKKSTVRKASATRKAVMEQPKRRGRPPGSKNKPKVISKSVPVKSKPAVKKSTVVGKAKRSTAVAAKKTTSKLATRDYTKKPVEKTDGRYTLDPSQIDYSVIEDWNPRPGSVPDRIQRALKRFRGNRQKVFDFLYESEGVWEFVGKKMADGSKRSLDSAVAMLKYRIARTDWDFALKTGQHEKSENRIEYGTGEAATVRRKKPTPKRTPKAVVKPKARKAVTRPVKKTVQKAVRGRRTARKATAGRK